MMLDDDNTQLCPWVMNYYPILNILDWDPSTYIYKKPVSCGQRQAGPLRRIPEEGLVIIRDNGFLLFYCL
jgi:hypothetical protein